MSGPSFVVIMTDTQTKSMVGAYGTPAMDTPNLDRLAASGVRFDRAYTTCPLCTPARGGVFSGLHPQSMGAWANGLSPDPNVPLMGRIFRGLGYRAAYTGKWHLDGGGYFGEGKPAGGFEPDWWYDGKCYERTIGADMMRRYKAVRTVADLREGGFTEENVWGHHVADRAIDFLETVGSEPFVLATSFDEPHDPFAAPPEYWEGFDPSGIPKPDNCYAPLEGKPRLQQAHFEQCWKLGWPEFLQAKKAHFGCNSFIDREIGRVIDAATSLHGDDAVIIYTSDHGDMLGAHGLQSKGPMMYEEITNIPFIIRAPGASAGVASQALASHLDIVPTMLELAGVEIADELHGTSLVPALGDPGRAVRRDLMMGFHRYGVNQPAYGGFYPIRCLTDGRCKLALNLLDRDEFYDLAEDPGEKDNRIDDPAVRTIRNAMHERLLERMDEVADPFRGYVWGERPWNAIRRPLYKPRKA
jgi:uncharacterized sulfatase